MSGYGLTYRLIVCSSKVYNFKICNNFHIHGIKKKRPKSFLREQVSVVTPLEHTQTLLFYRLYDASTSYL